MRSGAWGVFPQLVLRAILINNSMRDKTFLMVYIEKPQGER
jgi:hypothetical protein